MNVDVVDMSVILDEVWGEDQIPFDITLSPLPMFLDSWRCILDETIDDIETASRLSMVVI